jgi:hypothetical protein
MAITFVTAGTAAVGTTTLSLPLPASIAPGNVLVLFVAHKYGALPAAPAGYEAVGSFVGGSGASGIDAGQARISVFVKRVSVAGESGNVTVTLAAGNAARGRILQYAKTVNGGTVWGWALAGGASNTPGLAWAITAGSDPGITAGDMILAASAVNGDGATFSAQALTATGITLGTEVERDDGSTTNGDDLAMFVSEHPVATGTAAAPAVYAATASATAASQPAGATAFLRLRELTGLEGGDLAAGVADYGQALVESAGHNVHYDSDVFLLTEGSPDLTDPVIQNVSPTPSTALPSLTTPIQFDVVDPPAGPTSGLLAVLITLKYAALAETLVVFDGAAFLFPFAEMSARTAIANGFHFSLLPKPGPRSGWTGDIEALRVYAIDAEGNLEGIL